MSPEGNFPIDNHENDLAKKIANAAAAISLVAAPVSATSQEDQKGLQEESIASNDFQNESILSKEQQRLGNYFAKEQVTYSTFYGDLTNREVMFVDSNGFIIGEKIRLDPIVFIKDGRSVIITPGNVDERGVLTGNISQAWLNQTRLNLKEKYGVEVDLDDSLPKVRSTIRLVRDAERFFDPGVRRPETFFDVIEYMGTKKVPNNKNGETYIDFIYNHFGENTSLPITTRDEIKEMIPGLVAQESQFNDLAMSPVGARGMFQIMPETQKKKGYGTEKLSFEKQVEFSGAYFADAYSTLSEKNSLDFEYIKQEFFAGNQEDFERYFLVPVLINTYNSGIGRLSSVISWFRNNHKTKEDIVSFTGSESNYKYDVYASMARLARLSSDKETSGYKEHSSEYFSRVFSLHELIEKRIKGK